AVSVVHEQRIEVGELAAHDAALITGLAGGTADPPNEKNEAGALSLLYTAVFMFASHRALVTRSDACWPLNQFCVPLYRPVYPLAAELVSDAAAKAVHPPPHEA